MFARTKRLTLRPGWPEDARVLTQAIGHESVVTRLSRVPWPYTESDARDFLTRSRPRDDVWFAILAHEDATPHLIGGIGVHPGTQPGTHELGYWLTPEAWGKGYATEAGQAVLSAARYALGVTRLRATHMIDNPASGKVLRKLGFRETGRCRQYSVSRRQDVECATFERTLDDEPCRMPIAA